MRARVFIIGAGGYLGSAVAKRLAKEGNHVTGLERDAARAGALESAGVKLVRGDILDPGTWTPAMRAAEVVVHAATGPDAEKLDDAVLEGLAAAARDSAEGHGSHLRRVIYTSGIWNYGDTGQKVVDERSAQDPLPIARWRPDHEERAFDLVRHHVEVIVFQLANLYGGSRGTFGMFFANARDRPEVRWPGTGDQHWPMLHREDAAEAYRLAAERPLPRLATRPGHREARGRRFILGDGSDATAREVIEAIARVSGVSARAWPRDEVVAALGEYGAALCAGQRYVSTLARRDLGWTPKHGSFVREVEAMYHEWLSGQGAPV